MVFFNDPVRCDDPAGARRPDGVAMRTPVQELAEGWRRAGSRPGPRVGIAQGYATLGRIGFEGRYDYAAIGSVTNLAARLCADAEAWQVLVTERVLASVEQLVEAELIGEVQPEASAAGCGSTTSPPSYRGRSGDEALAAGDGGCLGTAGGAQLAEDVGHVDRDGLGGDEQLTPDLAVAATFGDQGQDLGLARGERVSRGGDGRRRRGPGQRKERRAPRARAVSAAASRWRRPASASPTATRRRP